jgi:hypothetical protein
MKTFAGGMHTKSRGDKITRLLVTLSYCVLIALVLIAAVFALRSMSSVARKLEENPGRLATFTAHSAARAGVSAAVNHIQCHSYRKSGTLSLTSYSRGGRFTVTWEEPNLNDSTVRITSFGLYERDGDLLAEASIDTIAHLEFFFPHEQPKLEKFYSAGLRQRR